MVCTFVRVWDVGLKIMRQTQKLNVISGNRNKQRIWTCYFCVLARKFSSRLSSQPLYGWGWESGQKERELKLKAALTKRRQRLAGVRRGRGFLIPVALSVENFFLSLLPAFFVSINRFCLCGSFVEGCPAVRVPSLIGMCHSAEGKINRWPFLASPLFLPL